jgi:hypothetical protein
MSTSVADPGCFIPDPDPTIAPSRIRIPDPGGKKAPDPGSESATPMSTVGQSNNFFCLICFEMNRIMGSTKVGNRISGKAAQWYQTFSSSPDYIKML